DITSSQYCSGRPCMPPTGLVVRLIDDTGDMRFLDNVSAGVRVLLFCAKHLFVAANHRGALGACSFRFQSRDPKAHPKSRRSGGEHDLILILARDSEEETVGRARTKSGQLKGTRRASEPKDRRWRRRGIADT